MQEQKCPSLCPKGKWIALWIVILAFSAAGMLSAQEFRGNMSGQITDPSGAVVPDAHVSAVNNDTGQSYSATTSSTGLYNIPYMLPGDYTVNVSSTGFKTAVQDRVVVLAAKTTALNLRLVVGAVSQKITVTTNPTMLETNSSGGGMVLSSKEIENLPLNGRQIYMLLRDTPGSQFLQTQFGASGYSGSRGWDVSNNYTIGGSSAQAGNFNNFTLNGTNVTIMTGFGDQGTWMVAPNVDALQETNVMDQMYDARYGRTGGGVVNMVTKNGTNQFHGDVYEFLENGKLMDANTFTNNLTGLPVEPVDQNQFGGTFGGPIKRDRMFFFGSYEGYRESIPYTVLTTVPTAAMRSGDFSGIPYIIYDPSTTVCTTSGALGSCSGNAYARTSFLQETGANAIPANEINKSGQALMNYFPEPNIPGSGYLDNFVSAEPDHYDYNQYMGRVDYNTSDRTRWYSSFEFQKGHEFRDSSGFTGPAENGNINTMRENWVATQDVTHTFSTSMVGDFKLSFARFHDFFPNGPLSTPTPGSIGLNYPAAGTTTLDILPQITFSQIYPEDIGNQYTEDFYTNTVLDADFTKIKGRNNFEFGGEVGEYQAARPGPGGSPNGDFEFETQNTQYNPLSRGAAGADLPSGDEDGYPLADMLLGYPESGGVDWEATTMEGFQMWDVYAQDNIRVNHRLSVNVGLRYDWEGGVVERYNRLNRGLCIACVNPISSNLTYQQNLATDAPTLTADGINPASLAVAYGGIQFPGVNGQPRNAYNPDWTNIGPRIGFAYMLDNKTVLRGGFGWMYAYGIEGGTTTGFSETTSYVNTLNGGVTPTNYFQTGTPFPSGLEAPPGSSDGLLSNIGNQQNLDFPGRKIPRVQIMSLGVQRELPHQILLDVKYAGNYTRNLRDHIWINGTLPLSQGYPELQQNNYVPAVATTYDQQVPNPWYGVLPINSNIGSSSTIEAAHLLTPFSQFNLVGDYTDPQGEVWYDSLQAKLQKRLYGSSRGLLFSVAYTYSKNTQLDGWRNGWPWQDAHQIYEETGDNRTHILTVSGVWDIPMGRGSKFLLSNPSRPLGAIINDWRFSWIFTAESGFPVGDPGGWHINSHSFVPNGGPTFSQWIYNCGNVPSNCYESQPSFSQGNQPDNIPYLNQPTVPDLDIALERTIPITERYRLMIRGDAFNFNNTPLFPGPDTNFNDGPAKQAADGNWTGFGTVSFNQQNFARIVQLSLKLMF